MAAQNKFCYRLIILNTELQTTDNGNKNGTVKNKYNDLLPTDYVKNHLFHMVRANLKCKATPFQKRSWRLPVCIKSSEITYEMDAISDGCYGVLGGGAALVYLLQRYTWNGQDQVHIFLYSGSSALNPMLTPSHQLDSELIGFQIAQKEVHKALLDLGQFLGSQLPKPRLI